MDVCSQICCFAGDLDILVERYAAEFDLPFSAVIGALEIKKQALIKEQIETLEDD